MADQSTRLEAHIDRAACEATGMCMRVLPAVFGRGDDGLAVILGPVTEADLGLYEEAAAICPTAAISAKETS